MLILVNFSRITGYPWCRKGSHRMVLHRCSNLQAPAYSEFQIHNWTWAAEVGCIFWMEEVRRCGPVGCSRQQD
jgi:hypothetical protein